MGEIRYWILAAILFGVISGALYTWMSPRKERWLGLMFRSMAIYSAVALGAVYLLTLLT